MADNNDSFDEFLNRAEEDFDAANGDGEEDDLEGALADAEGPFELGLLAFEAIPRRLLRRCDGLGVHAVSGEDGVRGPPDRERLADEQIPFPAHGRVGGQRAGPADVGLSGSGGAQGLLGCDAVAADQQRGDVGGGRHG